LSDWVRTIGSLVQGWIRKLKHCVNSRPKSVFKDQEAVKCLSSLHAKYVIVPADKASNNIVFVCKSYYYECLIKELGINNNTSGNTTYKPTSFTNTTKIHIVLKILKLDGRMNGVVNVTLVMVIVKVLVLV
jgi:hypothetical protein